jgi:hypothetical protein
MLISGTFGEHTVSQLQVELLFDTVIKTYFKLKELGFTEVDGKIVFMDDL